MPRLPSRDRWATLLTTAAVLLYVLWSAGVVLDETWTRSVALGVFALGFASCMANQAGMTSVYGAGRTGGVPRAYVVAASLVGFTALVAGLTAMLAGSEGMLAVLVGAIVALWIMSTVRHLRTRPATTPGSDRPETSSAPASPEAGVGS